jgi:hypothetical protein
VVKFGSTRPAFLPTKIPFVKIRAIRVNRLLRLFLLKIRFHLRPSADVPKIQHSIPESMSSCLESFANSPHRRD